MSGQAGGIPGVDHVEGFLANTVEADRTERAAPLSEAVNRLAELGLVPGSPVLIAMPNGKALLTLFFAVLHAGGVPVPLAPASGAARVTEIARRLGAAALIAPRIAPERYGGRRAHTTGDAEVLFFPWPERRRHSAGEVILMTSGTSGLASGCLHGIGALLANARRHADAIGQRQDDTVLVNLPLHYSYALVAQAMAALVKGSRLVVSGPPFTAGAYHRVLRGHDVGISSLTPTLAAGLAESGFEPPKALRVLTVGGATLHPRHVTGLLSPGRRLYLTYGLTEAGPRVATLAAHEEPPHRYASVGLPLPGVRTRLRPPGFGDGSGELLVESETVLRRRVPEGGPDPLVAPGTVATGDVFEIDRDGYHYFRGRLADSVVVNGEKVWLPSIREIASSIPGVRRSATRVHRAANGECHYDLDVYVRDPGPRRVAEIERALARLLLRGERPRHITLHPASEDGWHK
ncbi:class I adenylate-forming enzyme family protein [Nonomuraea lactucae]|uniref:class I adenylate-forming enzyme family protein n=1 Tax=Nonomuraea lactucae TaxID=2249762 RepID=UPI0013B3E52C|nr:class I adenylate-forming enzyme family protein [Nonomuraea lactucae]